MADKKKRSLKGRIIISVIILLILYAGAHVISRTDGFRSLVVDKLSNGTRQPISLESCGMTPTCGLRLTGLTFQGVEISSTAVSFDWLAFVSKKRPLVKELWVRDAAVRFRLVPGGGSWEPLVMNDLARCVGAVLGLKQSPTVAEDSLPRFPGNVINRNTQLQLRDISIELLDSNGKRLAGLSGGRLRMKTGRFEKRKVIQTIVECGVISLRSGRELNDFRMEAFQVKGSGVVAVLEMYDRDGEYDEFASSSLWDDLGLHLNHLSAIR